MRKLLFIAFLLPFFVVSAQENRQVKDGIPVLTKEMNQLRFSKISSLKTRLGVNAVDELAVDHIDNSILKYFPPIFNQNGNSCAYASCVGYIYTYELNLLLDRGCTSNSQVCNYLYGYNFMNGATDGGGFPDEAWDTVDATGVPSESAYSTSSLTEWMTGYDKYFSGMENRVNEYYSINPAPGYVPNMENLRQMKQYLIDHGNGSAHGGLIQFSGFAHPLAASYYNGPSETGYDAIIPKFGTSGMHSMTIVGFDDSIEWDYNKNGKIEDDEKGAFLCVNTWGTGWGDQGRFYAPYKTFTHLRQGQGGTGNGGKQCLVVSAKKVPTKVTFKVRMMHDSRNDLKVRIGVSPNPNATSPSYTEDLYIMNHRAGDLKLRGVNGSSNNVLEFGVDVSTLFEKYSTYDDMAFFFEVIDSKRGTKTGSGQILYCSLMDYRKSKTAPVEILADLNSTELKNGSTCTAIAKLTKQSIEEGVNTDVKNFWSSYSKILTVLFNTREAAHVEIDILDKSGKLVANKLSKEIKAGSYSEDIDLSEIPSGDYSFRIITDNQIVYKKITIK